MAGDQLERRLEVDLSGLDASLRKEEALQTNIEQRVERTTRQIKAVGRDFSKEFSGGSDLKRLQGQLRSKGKSLLKGALKGSLSYILTDIFSDLTGEIPGLEPGSGAHFGGRLVAGTLVGAQFGGAVGAGAAAALTIYQELKDQWSIMKERHELFEKVMAQEKERAMRHRAETENELRRIEDAVQQHAIALEERLRGETAELIYQSSQYLDQ